MAFILTRLDVRDYDAWKPLFDHDGPGARRAALGHRLLRGVMNPHEVFIEIAYASRDDALAARATLLESGVLERFRDRSGPTVAETAEVVQRAPDAP